MPPTMHTLPAAPDPMLYGKIATEDLNDFLDSDDYYVEQKLDGHHCMVRVDGSTRSTSFWARGGVEVTQAADLKHLDRLERELRRAFPKGLNRHKFVLDGELLPDGTLWLFDLPFWEFDGVVQSFHGTSYSARRDHLARLRSGLHALAPLANMEILQYATTTVEKTSLALRVLDANAEGLIFKHRAKVYHFGKRAKHSLKAKFVDTVDAVVYKVEGESATLALYDAVHSSFQEIGKVSFRNYKGVVAVGDVVEVEYLGVTKNFKLNQPSFKQVRADRMPESCMTDQLTITSTEVLV